MPGYWRAVRRGLHKCRELRGRRQGRERYGSRSGERLAEPGEHRQISVERRPVKPTDSEAVATLPRSTGQGKELDVAGQKRDKSLPLTDKKTAVKPKRPKKTSRGK
jgi:hypothetical protein